MISVAIPTLDRGAILASCIERLLSLPRRAAEIIVVDQTREHPQAVRDQLREWSDSGAIRHIVLDRPSIPNAMNIALLEARSPRVLFLDDDSEVSEHLITEHQASYSDPSVWAVVGQVLQPGEAVEHFDEAVLRRGAIRDLEFRFNHDTSCFVQNVIACNLSVDRERAIGIGGFDRNYVAAAHRFETDFALRVVAAGGRILFNAAATVRHLKLPTGGLRSYGDHRTSASPFHSVGDYYFAATHLDRRWRYVAQRMRRNVLTRYLLRHPSSIPGKFVGELRGLRLAMQLRAGGPQLISAGENDPGESSRSS